MLSGIDQLEASALPFEAAKKYIAKDNTLKEDGSDDDSISALPQNGLQQDMEKLRSKLLLIQGSCMYQISVPDELNRKTYGDLYQHLTMQGIVPLGLLRGTFSNMPIGPKENKLPYVYTNPRKETELYSCDRVFVLSVKPLQVNRVDIKVCKYPTTASK